MLALIGRPPIPSVTCMTPKPPSWLTRGTPGDLNCVQLLSTQATAFNRTTGIVASVSRPGYPAGKALSAANSNASEIWLWVGKCVEVTGTAGPAATTGELLTLPKVASRAPVRQYAHRREARAVPRNLTITGGRVTTAWWVV